VALNVVVFGAGYWGKNILRSVYRLNRGGAKWVCDPNEDALKEIEKEFPQVLTTRDFQSVLEDEGIDVAFVITPPSLHYSHAKASLLANKHTWVEKPLTMSLKEAEELVEVARGRGVVLFVDETFLYDPALRVVKAMIDGGRIGKIYHLCFQRLGLGRVRCDSNVWWNSAPHDLSILRYLVGVPVKEISLRSFSYLQSGIEDVACASVTLQHGISAVVYLSWFYPISTASVTIIGEKGAIWYEGRFRSRKVTLFSYKVGSPPIFSADGVPSPNLIPIEGRVEEEVTDFGNRTPLDIAVECFFAAIEKGEEQPSLAHHCLETMRILEAAKVSSRQGGRPVQIGE
jgi:UDP-2-acetamido-3-amino-2,3-dideoxy-glucuronate N-acetyltransferase